MTPNRMRQLLRRWEKAKALYERGETVEERDSGKRRMSELAKKLEKGLGNVSCAPPKI